MSVAKVCRAHLFGENLLSCSPRITGEESTSECQKCLFHIYHSRYISSTWPGFKTEVPDSSSGIDNKQWPWHGGRGTRWSRTTWGTSCPARCPRGPRGKCTSGRGSASAAASTLCHVNVFLQFSLHCSFVRDANRLHKLQISQFWNYHHLKHMRNIRKKQRNVHTRQKAKSFFTLLFHIHCVVFQAVKPTYSFPEICAGIVASWVQLEPRLGDCAPGSVLALRVRALSWVKPRGLYWVSTSPFLQTPSKSQRWIKRPDQGTDRVLWQEYEGRTRCTFLRRWKKKVHFAACDFLFSIRRWIQAIMTKCFGDNFRDQEWEIRCHASDIRMSPAMSMGPVCWSAMFCH